MNVFQPFHLLTCSQTNAYSGSKYDIVVFEVCPFEFIPFVSSGGHSSLPDISSVWCCLCQFLLLFLLLNSSLFIFRIAFVLFPFASFIRRYVLRYNEYVGYTFTSIWILDSHNTLVDVLTLQYMFRTDSITDDVPGAVCALWNVWKPGK